MPRWATYARDWDSPHRAFVAGSWGTAEACVVSSALLPGPLGVRSLRHYPTLTGDRLLGGTPELPRSVVSAVQSLGRVCHCCSLGSSLVPHALPQRALGSGDAKEGVLKTPEATRSA